MAENSQENVDSTDIEDLAIKKSFPLFLIFRVSGMLFLGISMFFLFQKEKQPLLILWGKEFRNGPLGNILLTLGAGLFSVYLISRVVLVLKRK